MRKANIIIFMWLLLTILPAITQAANCYNPQILSEAVARIDYILELDGKQFGYSYYNIKYYKPNLRDPNGRIMLSDNNMIYIKVELIADIELKNGKLYLSKLFKRKLELLKSSYLNKLLGANR